MDIRTTLSNTKHFISLPLPVFQYLCSLEVTQAQEHVFMLHWFEGQMRGDWKSEMPISVVAKRLSMSVATVKRAYKALGEMGLIRRHDQGRCQFNPMRSAVTVTEVTIPEDAIEMLMRAPDRLQKQEATDLSSGLGSMNADRQSARKAPESNTPTPRYEALQDEDEELDMFGSHSYHIQHHEALPEELDRIDDEFQAPQQIARSNQEQKRSVASKIVEAFEGRRKLTLSFASKVRSELSSMFSGKELDKLWQQVLWSIEEGHLVGFHVSKSKNIALKLMRTKRWTQPKSMPSGWEWSPNW